MVNEHAQNVADQDASVNQRVSKAVTEAFVAVQVRSIIKNLALPEKDTTVLRALYTLVRPGSFH